MDISVWVRGGVLAVILAALAVDLFVFRRDAHEVSIREAATTSAVSVALGLSFGIGVWSFAGGQPAGEYFAGHLIEKALSVENIFVFALILGYFSVPPKYQHRVLVFGGLGDTNSASRKTRPRRRRSRRPPRPIRRSDHANDPTG